MSLFTNVGTGLWSWEPFRRLERSHDDLVGRCTKLFWLALYTTPEAKMVVPGMFLGSVTTMADAARIPVDDARSYLDRLLQDDLVEYDIENRVLRMTVLPDCGESPSNGKAIRGWWRKFQGVPDCSVRNNHVTVLRWIMDEWSRRNGKPISNDHAAAWSDTFGRLPMPAPRRKTPRHEQTSLFDSISASDPKTKQNNHLDTNTSSTRVERDQDPDTDLDPGSRISEGGSGGGRVLALVPRSGLDADDLAEMLHEATGGKFVKALTRDERLALQGAITSCGEWSGTDAPIIALREFIAAGAPGMPTSQLSLEDRARGRTGISPALISTPGWLSEAIGKAVDWKVRQDRSLQMFAESRKQLGFE